jgi:hypothetical protein
LLRQPDAVLPELSGSHCEAGLALLKLFTARISRRANGGATPFERVVERHELLPVPEN